jgi:Na+/glutamate symporter
MLRLPQLRKGGREIALFSSFVVIYFIAITGPIVGVKYRLPIEPIMTMFFAYAFVYFRRNSER